MPQQNLSCSQSCVNAIKNATAQAVLTPQPTTPAVQSQNKEFFIPLGGGTYTSTVWQNVPGMEVSINNNSYKNINIVTFEASLYVPTGNENVSLRLFDITNQHPVWYSEINFQGSTNPNFLSSEPIRLDNGNNLYAVQMKTQLEYPAVINQARIHILTN